MPRVEASTLVHASPERVFAQLVDVPSSTTWLSGVSEAAFVSPGTPAVGTKFRQIRKTMGRDSRVDGTFVGFEPNRKLVLEIQRDGKPAGVVTWSLAPEGDGTSVHCLIDFQLPGLMKLMSPMVRNVVAKQNVEDLGALKRKVEG